MKISVLESMFVYSNLYPPCETVSTEGNRSSSHKDNLNLLTTTMFIYGYTSMLRRLVPTSLYSKCVHEGEW